jgi:hypothetical protein
MDDYYGDILEDGVDDWISYPSKIGENTVED